LEETINKVVTQVTSLLTVSDDVRYKKLSKLQKEILVFLYNHKNEFPYNSHSDSYPRRLLTDGLAKKLGRLSDKPYYHDKYCRNVSPSFSVVVCNSLKSLIKRGLVVGLKNGVYSENITDVRLTPDGERLVQSLGAKK